MSGARVFVRLYDGATQREGDGELLMLPPPPLMWKGVLSMMIMAVAKEDDEPDAQRIARVRLFLLPTDAQGIVAELNARSLRFGVRDNDQFAICLNGEEYKRPDATTTTTDAAAAVLTTMATASTGASMLPVMTTTRLNDYSNPPSALASSMENGPPRGGIFASMPASGPPGGSIMGDTGSRKPSKRYRSISGKMAAIKSLGDKGLISAEDRGHLKDLLLNNDSPALQEALDNYQNTGDFHAVKELLFKELRNPSAKRATGDWLPEGLINEISENFQTHDNDDTSDYNRSYAAQGSTATPANPFMYSTTTVASHHASPSTASDYTTAAEPDQVHPLTTTATGYDHHHQQHQHPQQQGASWAQGGIYAQQAAYGSTAQINLPLRNRNSVNLMLQHRGVDGPSPVAQTPATQPMLHGNPVEIGYAQHPTMTGYTTGSTGYAAQPMGYATPTDEYGMNAYGVQMRYPTAYYHQQPVMYGASPYGAPQYGAMPGYEGYYAAGCGYLRPGHMGGRMGVGGKWTTAPPMPAYPPPCSKEEKKEKIAKWLKKRENRNWSNKPSYPVRHNIAKNRKRGEDGRFITKKRLAEMETEEQARIAAGLPPSNPHAEHELDQDQYNDEDDGSGSDREASTAPLNLFDANTFEQLPAPTTVHM